MKAFGLILMLAAACSVYAQAAPQRPYLTLTGTILNERPAVGDEIRLKIFSKARDPYFFHATRLFIYRKDAVPGMFDQAGLKITKHKSAAGFDAAEIIPWAWFPRQKEAEAIRTFSTAKWLPGHYVIHIHALYYPQEGNKGYVFSGSLFELDLQAPPAPKQ